MGHLLPEASTRMRSGLVTTIIPVYNRADQLREAVQSVLDQDYRPIEIIIVDDGSTDNTLESARVLERQHPELIRVATQANGGPGKAREHGRQLARGEFIQYLDSDDILLPGKFSAQVAALTNDVSADVAYGITFLRNADGNLVETPHKLTGKLIPSMFPDFLIDRWWETATPLYRASICAKAGPWTSLSLEEDWEYDCRIASSGGKLVWCPFPVSEHRDHEGGRLSRGAAIDKSRLRQRAISHELIYGHAVRAGLGETPEMDHFARALFLLSRQSGAAGLTAESQKLFELARNASGRNRGKGLDFISYKLLASVLGWKYLGKICCLLDRFKK